MVLHLHASIPMIQIVVSVNKINAILKKISTEGYIFIPTNMYAFCACYGREADKFEIPWHQIMPQNKKYIS
jgi:uncharacterized glyoxalase superfamily protein PhnB